MRGLTRTEVEILRNEDGPLPDREEFESWEANGILDEEDTSYPENYGPILDSLVVRGCLAVAEFGEHRFFSLTPRGRFALRVCTRVG